MWFRRQAVLLLFAAVLGSTSAQQEFEYLPVGELAWTANTNPVSVGNGLFMAPDGAMLVSTSTQSAVVRAFDPMTGEVMWTFQPSDGASCQGGIFFNYNAAVPYLVYIVSILGDDETSRVIALDLNGGLIFESTPLPGTGAGTPVTTFDGQYILTTHNVGQSEGHFTMFDVFGVQAGVPLAPLLTNSTDENPFSPIGYFHNPVEGFFRGGNGNMNDVFLWAMDTDGEATTAEDGATFAFQLPNAIGAQPAWNLLRQPTEFQSRTAPVITNFGRSMYWSVTRAQTHCWIGSQEVRRSQFHLGRTEAVGFSRGNPRRIGALASPTLSSSPTAPSVYGPGAAAEIFKLPYECTDGEQISVPTSDIVSGQILISPDDAVIYYGTQDGFLVQADADTLEPIWSLQLVESVMGHMAMSRDGTKVYVPGQFGTIFTFQVAQLTGPTPSPTASPTLGGTAAPTMSPTMSPTTPAPTEPDPSEMPSDVPTSAPTSSPVIAASDSPSDTPSSYPSFISDFPSTSPTSEAQSPSPTWALSSSPTDGPTTMPTGTPTDTPTGSPNVMTTGSPNVMTTDEPTDVMTESPTLSPTTASAAFVPGMSALVATVMVLFAL